MKINKIPVSIAQLRKELRKYPEVPFDVLFKAFKSRLYGKYFKPNSKAQQIVNKALGDIYENIKNRPNR
jgi:acyl carrier protein phosphodiesterase